jgi:hypothetical protein
MEDNKPLLDKKSRKLAAKEDKALDLLEKYDEIILSDDFNEKILNQIKIENKQSSYRWYKSFTAIAASIIIIIVIGNMPGNRETNSALKVAHADLPIVKNLDLLEKMELLDHLDILLDVKSTQLFLQLLEKG